MSKKIFTSLENLNFKPTKIRNHKFLTGFIFLIIFLIVFGFLLFNFRKTEKVEAGSGENVYGWAWSDKIGWISFNNTSGGEIINYGVNIDSVTGNFSGYAWSRGTNADVGGIGWIKFDPVGPYPEAPTYSTCLDLPGTGQTCEGIGNYNIGGWARAYRAIDSEGQTLGGWEGWIKLRGTYGGGAGNYGVKLNQATKEFEGWAWGGDPGGNSEAVIGWISFNCSNQASCGAFDYKVITTLNFPPYVEAGSQISSSSYCNVFAGQGRVDFQWKYKDPDSDPQTQFDFRVNDVNDVDDNPEVDRSFGGLNNPDGAVNNQAVLVNSPLEADKITYDTPYYWWVKVYDNQGKDSGWIQYNDLTDSDGDGNPLTFTTIAHGKPWIAFDLVPQFPSVDEIVQFTDQSTCYDINNNPVVCGGISSCGTPIPTPWCWSFPTSWVFEEDFDASSQNPLGKFTTSGGKTVSLTVTDSDDFYCTDDKTIGVQLPFPKWKEILPSF